MAGATDSRFVSVLLESNRSSQTVSLQNRTLPKLNCEVNLWMDSFKLLFTDVDSN